MILDVTTSEKNGFTVVALKGRLSLGNLLVNTENKLRQMIEAGPVKLVLDLTELDYMDSAGIGMLMMCAGNARSRGGEFSVAGPNDRVRKIFQIANVDQVINVYPTVEAATGA